MKDLAQQIQQALDDDVLVGAVAFSDGTTLRAHQKLHKHPNTSTGGAAPPPIVKPAVLATSGDLTLYSDCSIGSAAIDAYSAGYKGPAQMCYGIFWEDALEVFPQIAADPKLMANFEYNRMALRGPMGGDTTKLGVTLQGYSAAYGDRAAGHIYAPGSIHPIRGTLAVRAKTTDIPALLAEWAGESPPHFPIQIEQGASGVAFP